MTTIQIDRAKYAEEVGEPIELLDPFPQVAPARNGVALLPFKLALPDGSGRFVANFEIEETLFFVQLAVRFGNLPPAYYPSIFVNGAMLYPGDTLTIFVRG